MDLHVSPTALLSPSKAREHLALVKDWEYIDNWLAAKYASRKPPSFERNHDTLKALLALAAFNDNADEGRDLMAAVEAKALAELLADADDDLNAPLLAALESALSPSGHQALESLASLSVALSTASVSTPALSAAILSHTSASHALTLQIHRLQSLHTALLTHLVRTRAHHTTLLSSPPLNPPSSLPKTTASRARATKQLTPKLAEYRTRIESLPADKGKPPLSISDVARMETEVRTLAAQVKTVVKQVEYFEELPWGKEEARREVVRVGRELEALGRRRDGLFEGLVERGG
ncbi:MAG: hypothetical protein M1833_005054 [Piccolia ochrophora]|nr:MAG: hypothetical protein M1833_005054 [Piccolia ochrophora]